MGDENKLIQLANSTIHLPKHKRILVLSSDKKDWCHYREGVEYYQHIPSYDWVIVTKAEGKMLNSKIRQYILNNENALVGVIPMNHSAKGENVASQEWMHFVREHLDDRLIKSFSEEVNHE